MTTKEFSKTSVHKILERYNIKENLTPEEYYKLLKLLIEECSLNSLRNMGIDYLQLP